MQDMEFLKEGFVLGLEIVGGDASDVELGMD
jgi:hypothetical protein